MSEIKPALSVDELDRSTYKQIRDRAHWEHAVGNIDRATLRRDLRTARRILLRRDRERRELRNASRAMGEALRETMPGRVVVGAADWLARIVARLSPRA